MEARASDCPDEDEILSFVDGALGAERRGAILAHIDGCESCQALAAELARDLPAGAPSPSQLDSGELVGDRFLLDRPLGKGAMGTVFRAHDQRLGLDVALKLMRRDDPKQGRAAFLRELEVGRRITHPNVCRLHDAGSTEHYDYITMELIEGDTLAHLLAQGDLPRARVFEVLRGIAAGLGAAHALGIVHRDLKPANVMVERATGRVVLTDFGFATDLDAKQSRRLVGTPAYWAPEQARGEPATPACDVYAFGVLAYRLLTGGEFSLSNPRALELVPRDVRRALAKCLEPRPTDRYANATEAGAALAAQSVGRPRTSRLVLLGAAVVGVAAVVVLQRARPTPARGATVLPAESATALAVPSDSAGSTALSGGLDPRPAVNGEPAVSSVSVSASVPAPSSASAVPSSAHPPGSSFSGATSGPAAHRPVVLPQPSARGPAPSTSVRPAASAPEGDLLYRR